MAEKFISERNLKFLLYDMFDVESVQNLVNKEIFEFDLSQVDAESLARFFHERAVSRRRHSSL